MRKLGSLLVLLSLGLFTVGCSGDTSTTPAPSTPPAAGGSGTADSGTTGTTAPAEPAAGSETKTDDGGSTDAGS